MRVIKLSFAFVLFFSGFSAGAGLNDYTSVFKNAPKERKSDIKDFQTNLAQDLQSLFNIFRRKKVVAVLKTSKKKTSTPENKK